MATAPPVLDGGWRARLRALPVFPDGLAGLDLDALPEHPLTLVERWLGDAITAELLQPHAASIATVDGSGEVSSRALILKDLTPEGVWFAKSATSPMGRDLAERPVAAILLYWKELGRQLRIEGPVEAADPGVSAADFAARGEAARAEVLVGRQSEARGPADDAAAAIALARRALEADPALVAPHWTAYLLRPTAVEFWAAAADRDHLRVAYRCDEGAWRHDRLWA